MTRPATLDHFRYSAPAWWDAFMAGRQNERNRAQKDGATWDHQDWHRSKAGEIGERTEG